MELKPGYKPTELGAIPEDWEAVRIGDLFAFKNGLNKAKRFFGYGTPIINYMDVFGRPWLRAETIAGRVDVSPNELSAYEVRKGDVFFTRTSEIVEEVGIASVMLDAPQKTVYSGFVLRARPIDESLVDTFKSYCFSSRYFRQQVIARASYTTRALTNGRSLSAALLARPPKSEQLAIATALSDIDALLDGLARLIAKRRNLKQATMQQLLTGQTRLPGFNGDWETVRADEIGVFKGGSGFPIRYQGAVAGDYPFCKVSDMNNAGNETFMFNANNYISESVRRELGAVVFPPNSIAFAKVGAAVFLERKKLLPRATCLDNNMAGYILDKFRADSRFIHYLMLNTRLSDLVSTTALPSLNAPHYT